MKKKIKYKHVLKTVRLKLKADQKSGNVKMMNVNLENKYNILLQSKLEVCDEKWISIIIYLNYNLESQKCETFLF